MKTKILSALAIILTSATIGGGISYIVSQHNNNQTNDSSESIPTQEYSSAVQWEVASDTHLTSYTERQPLEYPDLTQSAEMGVKAVVSIVKTESAIIRQYQDPLWEFFGIPQGQQPQTPTSAGSGVIISPDGYIVTNNHVIEDAESLKVRLYDGQDYDAKIIGADPTTDIALIKIEASGLPTLSFGSSDALRLGEWVLAIGSPYGLQSTVTAGIVSAKARTLRVIPNAFSIESFIQTDAAVNPGNSGGALVNARGELIGINTVIKSPTGSYAGYSFAVPETIVQKVVSDLKEFGIVQRAVLGITYNVVNQQFLNEFGEKYGITEIGGVYVAEVSPNGAAHSAGIKTGDVIIEIDGVKIDSQANLSEEVAKHRPGDKIAVIAKRDNKVKQFDVVLRNKTGKVELTTLTDAETALDGSFRDLSKKELEVYNVQHGVLVEEVNRGGVLSNAGVRVGYVITHINEKPIRSIRDIQALDGEIKLIEGAYPNGRQIGYVIVGK